jgi:hypothetical protein
MGFILALLIQLPGCYSWRVRSLAQQRRVTNEETLRLLLSNGNRVEVHRARAAGDSIVGVTAEGSPLVLPTGNVRDISARHFDLGKTVFIGAGVGAAAILTIGLMSASTCGAGGNAPC